VTWLYVPGTSSHCAQESEDSNSESCSPSTAAPKLVEGSVTWRGKPQLLPAWSRRWRAGGFIRLLSGLTCSPSTLDLGVASFISSLRETPARTTASPESGPGRKDSDSLPRKSFELPTSAGLMLSSARTCQGMRTDSLRPSSRHWSGWATALRQEYSVRPRPETPCDASDLSSWPSASDVSSRGGSQSPQKRRAGGHAVNLEDVAENWHTPRANDAEKRGDVADDPRNGLMGQVHHWMGPNVPNGGRTASHAEKLGNTLYHGGKKVQLGLEHQAKDWSAPKASDGEKGGPNQRGSKGDIPLPGQAANWPGPATRDYRGSSEGSMTRSDGKSRADLLDYAAEQFFRPPSSQDQPIAGGSMSSTDGQSSNQPSAKRKLNPIFVEALMRWPTGLSGFERQEMAWTRWWALMPSFVSALCSQKPEQQMTLL
jgi:hypothetical protein